MSTEYRSVMPNKPNPEHLLFLAWGSPWPAFSGGDLRTLGLLRELSKVYPIHLLVVASNALSDRQEVELSQYAHTITRVPMVGTAGSDAIRLLTHMYLHQMPYHCARLALSFERVPEMLNMLRSFSGIVYASYGHWGTLIRGTRASNWILDQQNADIHFWRVYASQTNRLRLKAAALLNWQLAARHFPLIYKSVGRVVSVCETDRQLTLDQSPHTLVDVIENGVDCAYFAPERSERNGSPRLLFTGTSAPRNMIALQRFMKRIFPLIRAQCPDAELLVGGDFKIEAQSEFAGLPGICFTGRVDDIRPAFNQSDVFVAPFAETHGSKLKIAEAMAMAMPIVATPEGVRGFELTHGQSVLIANSDQEFALYCIKLLKSSEHRNVLGKAARQKAIETVDWLKLGQRLSIIIENTFQMITTAPKHK